MLRAAFEPADEGEAFLTPHRGIREDRVHRAFVLAHPVQQPTRRPTHQRLVLDHPHAARIWA